VLDPRAVLQLVPGERRVCRTGELGQDLEGLAEVRRRINLPVVTGEALYSKNQFAEVFARRAADILNPDVCNCGGILALKEIASEFGDRRAVPSMAYMLGFFAMGLGGVFMGWLADRTSPRVPLLVAGVSIFAGGWLAVSGSEWLLYLGYALPLGFLGNAATFTPAMNNIQGWFEKRRSTAVSNVPPPRS